MVTGRCFQLLYYQRGGGQWTVRRAPVTAANTDSSRQSEPELDLSLMHTAKKSPEDVERGGLSVQRRDIQKRRIKKDQMETGPSEQLLWGRWNTTASECSQEDELTGRQLWSSYFGMSFRHVHTLMAAHFTGLSHSTEWKSNY